MPTDSSTNDDPDKEKSKAEKTLPSAKDVVGLMVSVQRLHQQLLWQMGEVMADMMSMPLGRDREEKKSNSLNRCVSDLKDAIDGATEILQQGGKPH